MNDPVDIACDLHEQAVEANERGDLEEAERLARQSLELLEAAEGVVPPDVANVLNELGDIMIQQTRFEEAKQIFERSVAIMEPVGVDEASRWSSPAGSPPLQPRKAQGRTTPNTARPISRGARASARFWLMWTCLASHVPAHGDARCCHRWGGKADTVSAIGLRVSHCRYMKVRLPVRVHPVGRTHGV